MSITAEDVDFHYGLTVPREQMEARTIYLDGVVRGPVIDTERASYSFDHHGECVRLVTQATCQQVRTALELGLDSSGFRVVLNDLDADSSLALWLLRHPDRSTDDRMAALVDEVAFIDAHGPVREIPPLMKALEHSPEDTQDLDTLWEDQQTIDAWYRDGDSALPASQESRFVSGVGLRRDGTVEQFGDIAGFGELYDRGFVAGLLCPEAPGGTIGYIVGKRSEFVDFDVPAFLREMNTREQGWGGASTIGGAPRQPDGRRSEVSVHEVAKVFNQVASRRQPTAKR